MLKYYSMNLGFSCMRFGLRPLDYLVKVIKLEIIILFMSKVQVIKCFQIAEMLLDIQ